MWRSMFVIQIPVMERVLRALIVYGFLLSALRLFGRRELGQMKSFDIIVLLTLSNILQNAMIGNDLSITGGIVGAGTLLVVNLAVAFVTFRVRRAERLVDGGPRVLVRDGEIQAAALKEELLTEQDLLSAIRGEGIESLREVRLAISEPNGRISVIATKT